MSKAAGPRKTPDETAAPHVSSASAAGTGIPSASDRTIRNMKMYPWWTISASRSLISPNHQTSTQGRETSLSEPTSIQCGQRELSLAMELGHGAGNPAIVQNSCPWQFTTSQSCLQPARRTVDSCPGNILGRVLPVRNGLDCGSHR